MEGDSLGLQGYLFTTAPTPLTEKVGYMEFTWKTIDIGGTIMMTVKEACNFFTVPGCFLLAVGCSTPPISISDQHEDVTITLNRAIHFLTNEDTDVVVSPGLYNIQADRPTHSLILQATNSEHRFLLRAQEFSHAEQIPAATPLSLRQGEDEHHLLLFLPDNTGLEAVGSYSGIHSRAAPSLASKTPVFRRYPVKTSPQLSADFTLHVPVQIENASPDINQLKIQCWAHVGNDATQYNQRIGEGEALAPVTNRRYQGTVTVRFNASPGKEAQDADHYYCGMLFHKPGIGFRQPGKFGTILGNQKPDWLLSAENTPFRIHALGGLN